MIQFNLLPDVKLEYIRARRLKRTVVLISAIVAGSALTLAVLLFLGVVVFQKKHLNDLSADIKRDSSKLESIQDLDKILTVQNQLRSLPDLHSKKPVTSRLFTYVQQITPKSVSIASLNVDFEAQTMIIKGGGESISAVNQFVDTLKFTDYKPANGDQKRAFSAVVLTQFSRTTSGQQGDTSNADYEINLKYDPMIFDSASDGAMVVPNTVTTRSQTEKPAAVFQNQGGQ